MRESLGRIRRGKAIKKQLQYINRNLGHIERLQLSGAKLEWLSAQDYKMLLVVAELYRQQLWMYENSQQRIDDRIVSLMQPHIRPIVRGKAGTPVEFGAKLSVSYYNGSVTFLVMNLSALVRRIHLPFFVLISSQMLISLDFCSCD